MDSRNRQIVLLGESGTGKSASGNTILMKNAFHSEKSTREVTSECERGTAEINGRHVTVIDTPGLSDIKLENEEIQKKIKHFISDLSTPHVYLLLIKVGEYPKNAEKLVKFIQDTFGGNAMENAIVLFTGGDHLGKKTIEEYILKPKSKIRQIISQFGGRYHVFDNKNQVPLQVSDLLEKIDKMDAENTTMRGACTVKEARKNEGVLKRFAHQMQIKKKPYDSNNSQSKHYKQNKFKKSESEGDEKVTMHMSASKKKIDDVSSTRRHFSVQQNQKKTKVQEKSKNKLHEENKSVKVKNNNERQNEREDYLTEQKCIQMNEGRKVQPTAKPTYTSQATKPKSKTNTAEDKKQDNRLENQRKLCEIGQNNTKPLEGREVQPAIPTYTSQATKSEGDSKTAEDKKQDNRLENQSKLCEIGQNNTKPLEGREVQPTIPTYTSQATKSEGDSKTAEDKKQDNRLENQRELCEIKPHEGKNDRQTITYTSQEIKQPKPEGKNKTKMEKQKYKYISIEQKDRHTSIQSEKPTEKIEDLTTKKLKMSDILHISKHSLQYQEPQDKDELIICFIQKLIRINYTARYIQQKENNEDCPMDKKIHAINTTNYKKKEQSEANFNSHPMDVQMTVFHCADGFLKQLMLTKLSECQYALPLLVPIHSQKQIEFPLWAFRKITKSWKIKCTNNEIVSKSQPMYKAETPMVAFFRFGSLSTSKSQLMNSLINERHNTFFHRNCTGSSRTRVLMDGVVEIAWYCPSGKDTDKFTDCVAFCNLHGDAGDHEDQLTILTEMASVNVVLLLDRNEMTNIYTKPIVFLLTESNAKPSLTKPGEIQIGLKGRNQPKVLEELNKAIKHFLLQPSTSFKLDDMTKFSEFTTVRVDEKNDDNCKRAKEASKQLLNLLEHNNLTNIKELLLPCQGKMWHQWCQKNKELHRPQLNETEIDISAKKSAMKRIREKQQRSETSKFLQLFLKEIKSSLHKDERIYFLKWLGILLDERTSENLSTLRHKYAMMWTKVLKLKENNDRPQQLETEQKKT